MASLRQSLGTAGQLILGLLLLVVMAIAYHECWIAPGQVGQRGAPTFLEGMSYPQASPAQLQSLSQQVAALQQKEAQGEGEVRQTLARVAPEFVVESVQWNWKSKTSKRSAESPPHKFESLVGFTVSGQCAFDHLPRVLSALEAAPFPGGLARLTVQAMTADRGRIELVYCLEAGKPIPSSLTSTEESQCVRDASRVLQPPQGQWIRPLSAIETPAFHLQRIFYNADQPAESLALINRRVFKAGEFCADAEIVAIEPQEVRIRQKDQWSTLTIP